MYYYDSHTKYGFAFNYCDQFFALSDVSIAKAEILKADFCTNLSGFLVREMQAPEDVSLAVAMSLFSRMSAGNLYYHTPVHVLSMFMFSIFCEIELEPWEQLAIWFHDAIYHPDALDGYNEQQSANFMRAILPCGLHMTNRMLAEADKGILSTGGKDSQIDAKYNRLLDLDMCNLSWPYDRFNHVSQLIHKEYAQAFSGRKATLIRKRFFESLLSKDSIYRTELFYKICETRARENLTKAVDLLSK